MPLGLGSAPVATQDVFGRLPDLIANGQAFRVTTTQITTATNSNVWVAMQGVANNLSKHIFIYNMWVYANASQSDGRFYQNVNSVATDVGLTTNLLTSIQNQNPGGATISVFSVLNGSPAGTTQTSISNAGTQASGFAVTGNGNAYVFQSGSGLWLPKNSQNTFTVGIIVGTAGQKAGVTIEWVEFS